MKKLFTLLNFILICIILFSFQACDPSSHNPSASRENSTGILVLKLAAKTFADPLGGFPVNGGTLLIDVADISVGDITIEENSGNINAVNEEENVDVNEEFQSGFDGNQDGDFDDGDIDDPEVDDILLTGPFVFDISAGEIEIAAVNATPGVYKNVNFIFSPTMESNFNNNSIIISGTFTTASGNSILMTLNSEFSGELQTQISNNGIVIETDMSTSVVVTFDLEAWFNNMDFSTAELTNDEMMINNLNNSALNDVFVNNLKLTTEVGDQTEDIGDDTENDIDDDNNVENDSNNDGENEGNN